MQLSELQRDALVELLNIGFGRAGAALSELTRRRVVLDVPKVAVHPMDELSAHLVALTRDDVASVHQAFTGSLAGDALLILQPAAAERLKELLTDEPSMPLQVDASAREVLTEAGNILLNACIGSFGNVLDVSIAFHVPTINVTSLHVVLDGLIANEREFRYALVVTAAFRLEQAEVVGYLVIILSVPSLSRLLDAVEGWERSQV